MKSLKTDCEKRTGYGQHLATFEAKNSVYLVVWLTLLLGNSDLDRTGIVTQLCRRFVDPKAQFAILSSGESSCQTDRSRFQ